MIAAMTRWVGPVVGVLLVLLGGLWTLQGVGLVGGSFMTGSRLWLVIGLVLVVAGVALLIRLDGARAGSGRAGRGGSVGSAASIRSCRRARISCGV